MIRNVVVGRVRPGVEPSALEPGLQALRDLTVEGVAFTFVGGLDMGLRDGGATFAITADFLDEEDYRRYDADPEHNRIRAELFAPFCAAIERVQFQLS